MYEFCTDYQKLFENIVNYSVQHLKDENVTQLLLGVSGGIDSALTVATAKEVTNRLKRDYNKNLFIRGIIINIESKADEIMRAQMVARNLCDTWASLNMTFEYQDLYKKIMFHSQYPLKPESERHKEDIRKGNIKARMRMIQLYDAANALDGLVLSTDNYTEYLLGFWTLHGDVGDFGMIQNLWKTEVYGLSQHLVVKYTQRYQYNRAAAINNCINATPTDGLGVTNSDFDQIYPGYDKKAHPKETYKLVDKILQHRYLESNKNDPVVKRFHASEYKRNNPFNIPRDRIVP